MIQRSLLRQACQISTSASALRPSLAPSTRQPSLLSSRLPAPARARIASRWYSDEKRPADVQGGSDESLGASAPADATAEPSSSSTADASQKELEAKNKEIVDLKDKYLRQVAEFRNLQERTRRDMQAAKDFAIQRFAKDLVESVDTFDLALSQVSADKLAEPMADAKDADPHKELRQLHGGLKMTETVLLNTLKKHGLERFDPSEKGEKFDPNLHEATFQTPQPDKTDGTVFFTTQKGFLLNGRVLRAAKVGVVKNS